MVGARPKNSTEVKIQKYLTEKTRHFSKEKYRKWPKLLMMKPSFCIALFISVVPQATVLPVLR